MLWQPCFVKVPSMLMPRSINELRELVYTFVELVYPSVCAVCQGPPAYRGAPFCLSCLSSISPFIEEGPPQQLFLGLHQGPLRQSIKLMKHGHRQQPAAFMGRLLGKVLKRAFGQVDGLLAVPSSPRRGRDSADPATLVAREVSISSKIPLLSEKFLVKTRHTEKQAFLTMEERLLNVRNAFKGAPELKDKTIVLIDDVLTTGATMRACSQAIKEAGGKIFGTAFLSRRPLFVKTLHLARSKHYSQ